MSTTTSHESPTTPNQSPRPATLPTTTPAAQTERSTANHLRPTMAGRNVVPVAVTAGDKIESLRQWASGRCLSADRAGVYSRAEQAGARGRRIVREPGVN